MAKSRGRVKPDTSKWFLTDQPMSMLELVAELRREPHPEALLSRTAREWLLHRDLKPRRSSLLAVRRRPRPWRLAFRNPSRSSIASGPKGRVASPTSSISSPRPGASSTSNRTQANESRPPRGGWRRTENILSRRWTQVAMEKKDE
jgi:hypothetical protein